MSATRTMTLMEWLKGQRAVNALQLDLMTTRFDLDGALEAGQWELAWWARQLLLTTGVEFFLREAGVPGPGGPDSADRALEALDLLSTLNPELADEAWRLLERPAPEDEAEFRLAAGAAVTFLHERLGIPSGTRQEMIRLWADGTRLLREIATGLEIAGADSWYLTEDPAAQIGWYDEVLTMIEGSPRRGAH